MATSEVDIVNRALALLGTRSTVGSLSENSNESIQANIYLTPSREEILRKAPWNSATNFNTLDLICAAPGTPENPTAGADVWTKGLPAPPWAYEYAWPADCIQPLWIVPQFSTGFSAGVPITTAITGGSTQFWNGPPVKYKIGIDQIGADGTPAVGGVDTKVIWTNQEQAILCYIKNITDPDLMDSLLQQAWVCLLAARLAISLTGDKALANLRIQECNAVIVDARAADGNEGITINDITPDWIRGRGTPAPFGDSQWGSQSTYDWGGFIGTYT